VPAAFVSQGELEMAKKKKNRKKKKQRMCRLCKKRPTWRYKNNPGNAYCKRCYHKHIWEKPGKKRQKTEREEEYAAPEIWEIWQHEIDDFEEVEDDLIDDIKELEEDLIV